MTIQEVSNQLGISKDTLRYYEKLGFVEVHRNENGYREYNDENLEALQYIVVMKYAKFTLVEIAEVLQITMQKGQREDTEKGIALVAHKIKQLQEEVDNYSMIIKFLKELYPLVTTTQCNEDIQNKIRSMIESVCTTLK